MIELTEWARSSGLRDPWLILGKGPTFARRDRFDLAAHATVALNHVVREVDVDVAHCVDLEVVRDCADVLERRCRTLLLPRHPHVGFAASAQPVEAYFDELPVLRRMSEAGRLAWYNLATGPAHAGSPVVPSGSFSGVVVLAVLAAVGARTVRTLGVDGGRGYSADFADLAATTRLANGQSSFDRQLVEMRAIADEHGIDLRPLVEPLRIFVGAEARDRVAYRVLEHSIRAHTSIPVEVRPISGADAPQPRDPAKRSRTGFSFARFAIPAMAGRRGRALYLDSDMLVFGDVAELADIAFDGRSVLTTSQPEPPEVWRDDPSFKAGRQLSVMLLDCEALDWDAAEIVAGLDEGRYTYEALMQDLCVVAPDRIADAIPPEWNHLERYEPGTTKLLHLTNVPTQPWRSGSNPLGAVWMQAYREAVEAGAVPPEEVESLVAAGEARPELLPALASAPGRRSAFGGEPVALAPLVARVAQLEAELAQVRSSVRWRVGSAIVDPLARLRRLVRSRAGRS